MTEKGIMVEAGRSGQKREHNMGYKDMVSAPRMMAGAVSARVSGCSIACEKTAWGIGHGEMGWRRGGLGRRGSSDGRAENR